MMMNDNRLAFLHLFGFTPPVFCYSLSEGVAAAYQHAKQTILANYIRLRLLYSLGISLPTQLQECRWAPLVLRIVLLANVNSANFNPVPTARTTAVLPTTEGTAGSPAPQSLHILLTGAIPPSLLSTRVTLPRHQHPSTGATPPRHQHLSTGAAPPRHQHLYIRATPPRNQHPFAGATTPRHQHLSTRPSPIRHCSRASLSPTN